MKLIDILVEELPKSGGWPDGAVECYWHRGFDVAHFYDSLRNEVPNPIYIRGASLCGGDGFDVVITREQYEAALAAKNEGWIEWGGGECPVEEGVLVDVKYRDGAIKKGLRALIPNSGRSASRLFWVKDNLSTDIIAYRLHQPTKAEQVRADAWNAYAGITESDGESDLNECIGQDAAPAWDGAGPPPVGCECEVSVDGGRSWCTYRAINEKNGARLIEIGNFTEEFQNNNWIFRPIRSEAERKREEAVKAIMLTGWCQTAAEEIYDLVAAGKVPGMKLED